MLVKNKGNPWSNKFIYFICFFYLEAADRFVGHFGHFGHSGHFGQFHHVIKAMKIKFAC